MVWHNLGLGGVRRSGATLRRNPESAGKTLTFPSTPIYVRRKGVAQWTFLLGCVRLGHRNMRNQILPQIDTRFHPVRPKGEFSPLRAETHYRESEAGEAGHT